MTRCATQQYLAVLNRKVQQYLCYLWDKFAIFLKELDLTEGRSTDIPTIQEEMQKNGSPRAMIETNDERSFINVFIPVHEGCGDKVILNDTQGVPQDVPQDELDDWNEELGRGYSGHWEVEGGDTEQ